MNALGKTLGATLRKTFGRAVDVVEGPYHPPPLGGLRPTLFVAVDSFVDHGGITGDGARSGRFPIAGRTATGYWEERPGRITVSIACVSLSCPAVQALCASAAPAGLAALAGIRSVSLGATGDGTCTLEFRDVSASLSSLTFRTEPDKDRPFCLGTIAFHLDGFLKVELRGTTRIPSTAARRPPRKKDRRR